jgi:uncharacterized protein with von Willebrand factor type A (vWA) domain
MSKYAPLKLPENPCLADNIVHFSRALRRAGIPIGTGRVIDAIHAVLTVGFMQKQDFYWTLHACFVNRPEHKVVFSQIFRLYWRDPQYLEHIMSMMLPTIGGIQADRTVLAAEKRAVEALLDGQMPPAAAYAEDQKDKETLIVVDASFTISETERFKKLDFEQMSSAEIAQAKAILARFTLPVKPLSSRRTRTNIQGRMVDKAATLRASMRQGGDIQKLYYKKQTQRWPNLVVLCDISGSMSQYSRMVLHFLHAISNNKGAGWAKVHAFTFGTRLTNITRHLQTKDVDAALAAAGAEAKDWEGGTQIAECLHRFNNDWSRRVMGQGAVVLLITDGLDRDQGANLNQEMRRLHLSANRLIWLNPLLRWDKFAAKATGIKVMLPNVDSFRPSHSIASLEELVKIISQKDDAGEKDRLLREMLSSEEA